MSISTTSPTSVLGFPTPTSPSIASSSPRSSSVGSDAMDQDRFHDGHYVRLRSSVHRTYLHADEDGHGVSLSRSRASMNVAWAVHRNHQHVLLHSAAYGRYLAATDASAPRGCRSFRVEQRNYNELEEHAIRWQAVEIGSGDDVRLRHTVGERYGYLRANGRHLPWNEKVVSVDESDKISTMMQWVVDPIPSTERIPRLPRPNRFLLRLSGSLGPLLPSRKVVFTRNGERFCTNDVTFDFRGWSVFRLRNEVASRLLRIRRERNIPDDLVMYVRAGIHGRFTPLVVDLPRSSQTLVITVGPPVPANAVPGYPNVDAV